LTENPVTCGHCQTENPPGADFCNNCNQPLTQSAEMGMAEHEQAQQSGSLLSGDIPPSDSSSGQGVDSGIPRSGPLPTN
jgi:hypothetical protein